jgi:hypothetical protein
MFSLQSLWSVEASFTNPRLMKYFLVILQPPVDFVCKFYIYNRKAENSTKLRTSCCSSCFGYSFVFRTQHRVLSLVF